MAEATETVKLVSTPQSDLDSLTNILEANELPQERIRIGLAGDPSHSRAIQAVLSDPFGNLYRHDRDNNELVLVRKFNSPYV